MHGLRHDIAYETSSYAQNTDDKKKLVRIADDHFSK